VAALTNIGGMRIRPRLAATVSLALTSLFLALPRPCAFAESPPASPPDYKALQAELVTIQDSDQKYRLQLDGAEKAHGIGSPEVKALWATISKCDRDDRAKVTAIIDQYGWIGPDLIGPTANMTLFLVIQHSDLPTQQKYLPMMREAVKANKATASTLALLEDRVALGEHRQQTYGSQIGRDGSGQYYVRPLVDPDHVDERRARVGLGPLADYVKQWDIVWDPVAYKKAYPGFEAEK
jgi:hypothetical protein